MNFDLNTISASLGVNDDLLVLAENEVKSISMQIGNSFAMIIEYLATCLPRCRQNFLQFAAN
jgi:hypothetical protein